ncbi:DEAD/DEAH box helicase family protein [Haloechinothrix sp. YIM 98757]|uniref:DEAD/DEAH box helicase family protein n=1 Tax=Haloechinothrix aidingensis TaxID=2752311 RepID=A0A838ADA6_9PSEU|nr:DEAD/DEAH box helicase family protein [Haloechinothrix aidingensis]MBA0127286.1 DEAD/DEAH box helicase family protein [Haloechinothrix aidingensis]
MVAHAPVPDFADRLAAFESARFTELRQGQDQVLATYAEKHLDTDDLAIEMPTGEGKTLLALLIADYALDRGWSVAYLTGTRQLADRVVEEAEALGLDVVRFAAKDYGGAKLDDYHRAHVVAVMNYWVYFNSRPIPNPADLVIFDDVHLAEQPLSGLQTLRIPDKQGPARELYRTICQLVTAHTDAYPGLYAMLEGTAQAGDPPQLLSFRDWAAIANPIRDAIEASAFVDEDEIKYVWPTVREHLTRCGVLIGPSGIEIRPYHPPTALNSWYSQAKQRIYLSATLGTMDDLQRRIGGGPVTQLTTQQSLPPGETGERRLVLNPSSEQPFDPTVLGWTLRQAQAAGGRAAWLCASHAEADALQAKLVESGEVVYRFRAGDDSTVDAWSRAANGHLVTAGRYDGLDLAGDVCKLVVITTVPQASSEFERFVVAYLGDASFMRHRVGQRITQALGRANREASDRTLYLGLDPSFAQILADPAVRNSIPEGLDPTIRAALELYDEGWEATERECTAFWQRNETPAASPSEQQSPRRKPRPGRGASEASEAGEAASARSEVSAATDLWLADYRRAAENARNAASQLAGAGETEHAAFWHYVEAHAHFDRGRPEDLAAARKALQVATKDGPRTTWFRQLERTIASLEGYEPAADDCDRLFLAWDEWCREAGLRLDRVLSRGRTQLTGSHDQQCEGLEMLARLVAAHGKRAPKGEQSATDCRWFWSTARRAERRVWEVKTVPNGDPKPLCRDDVNQLLGQVEVERKRSPNARVYGCLLTPATVVENDAAEAAHDKIVLINHDAAVRLYDLLADRLRRYCVLCGDDGAEARGDARTKIEALLPQDAWLGTLLSPSHGKLITANGIETIFPSA